MKMLIRGLPNFAFTQTLEVDNPLELLGRHELRVRSGVFSFEGNYFEAKDLSGSGQRVSLYIEGVEENRGWLERLCFDSGASALAAIRIRMHSDGGLRTAGTSSWLELGSNFWYMVEPRLDPRYPALLAELLGASRET